MRPLPPAPAVVGIVNVTPDSFSDGGETLDPASALARALGHVEDGAAWLDLGAESTRPGAAPVPPEEELRRLLPALRSVRARTDAFVSVDTRNASTARAALEEGADAVNDVSMLRHDPGLAGEAARAGAGLVLMHSRATPRDMQDAPRYDDVVRDVARELGEAVALAERLGCARERLVIDPGFGFAKTAAHNLELLRGLGGLRGLGLPVLVGLSRKALVGSLLARGGAPRPASDRAAGSVGLALAAVHLGASYVRVHDVRATADALATFTSAMGGATCSTG